MAAKSLKPAGPEKQSVNYFDQPGYSGSYPQEEHSWILYFSFSSWLIISFIFISGIYKDLLLSADKKFSHVLDKALEKEKVIHVLVDQKEKNKLPMDETEHYLSDQNNEAKGGLTEKKGFQTLSKSRDLKLPTIHGVKSKSLKKNREKQTEKSHNNQFFAKILHGIFGSSPKKKSEPLNAPEIAGNSDRFNIPSNYEFKKEYALSWDKNGRPVIPTILLKHFKYFKHMLDEIQGNWAPPGGVPYPIYNGSYGTDVYIPGRSTYQTFPVQDIQIVFSLDEKGNVRDIKIWKSWGFESLDRSCVDAIERSGNFGPPPDDLLDINRVFIMPLTFRIIE